MDSLRHLASQAKAKLSTKSRMKHNDDIHLDSKGLLAWSPNDPENPKEWSRGRKWYISIVSVLMVVNGSMASSSPSACLPSISEKLNVSMEVSKLTVTLFLIGFCAGPCIWAPLSEFYGRRMVFYSTFVCYFAFTFLCAFTPNIEALLVARFLCGTFISGALANTPGIFVDLWGPIERGMCMNLFTCAMQMGPAIGPITSGFYQLKLDFRWNFYQLLWLGGSSLFIMPTIPETLPSQTLRAKAKRIRAAKIPGYENIQAPIEVEGRALSTLFKIALSRPWRILVDPIAFLVGIYITVVYSLLYMLFTVFPIIFIEKRGWNAGVGELPLISICTGAFFGAVYIHFDARRQRKRMEAGHVPVAEDALVITMTGAIIFPISMFWLAWSGEYNSVPWIVPIIGAAFLAASINIELVGFLSYLSESYLMWAASAQAGNTVMRSSIAAAAPLYTQQMFKSLGVAGGGSLIAGVAVLLAPIPFVFYKYGGKIRSKSKFTPTVVDDDQKPVERSTEEMNQQDHSTSSISVGDHSDVLEDPEKHPQESGPGSPESRTIDPDPRFEHSSELEKI